MLQPLLQLVPGKIQLGQLTVCISNEWFCSFISHCYPSYLRLDSGNSIHRVWIRIINSLWDCHFNRHWIHLSCTCLWLHLSWGIRNYGWTRAPINTSCWDGWNLALIHITFLSTDGWYGTSRIFKVIPRGGYCYSHSLLQPSGAPPIDCPVHVAPYDMKVRLGSIGVIAEPNVEVSKAFASVRDL